ncbi:unnamed protein product, partial [Phaeothamnion confervicola]
MPRLNSLVLVGRCGNDPVPRYLNDGKVVLNLSLAVKREYHSLERTARGIRYGEEETDWFPLEIWNREAEYAAKVITKGARIGIRGSFVCDQWTDSEGNERRTPKVLVNSIDLLESRAERETRGDDGGDG